MLHDFVFLESQPPIPNCRHMDRCSLLLYLDGCASCEFLDLADPAWEPPGLATAETFDPPTMSRNNGHAHRSCER